MPAESAATSQPRAQRFRYAATAFAPVVSTALLGVILGTQAADWYDGLVLPSFAPPGVSFAIIEAIAQLALGFGFHRVLNRPDWMPDRPAAIRAFWLQLGSNLAFAAAFFVVRSPVAGLVLSLGLLAAVVLAAFRFGRMDRMAGILAALCALWTTIATLVCLSIVIRS